MPNTADKPWLNPPPAKGPWPTEAEAKAATAPKPAPENLAVKIDAGDLRSAIEQGLSELESDIAQVALGLLQNKCDMIVVIGLNQNGEVITQFRPGADPQVYAMLGALEVVKSRVMELVEGPKC